MVASHLTKYRRNRIGKGLSIMECFEAVLLRTSSRCSSGCCCREKICGMPEWLDPDVCWLAGCTVCLPRAYVSQRSWLKNVYVQGDILIKKDRWPQGSVCHVAFIQKMDVLHLRYTVANGCRQGALIIHE